MVILGSFYGNMWEQLFKFNKTDRAWHLPIVAGLCVAIPLLLGFLFKDIEAGKLASIGALVILHIQSNRLVNRMMILMVCGFAWFILQMNITVLGICICIFLLQTIVEFLVVRNYGIAAIFISMLTIFLAEPNMSLMGQPNHLIAIRFFDILIGSIMGAVGGWLLYHEQIHFFTKKQLVKTKVMMKKFRR